MFYDNDMIILFIQIFSTLLMNIIQIHIEIESFVQKTSEDHNFFFILGYSDEWWDTQKLRDFIIMNQEWYESD